MKMDLVQEYLDKFPSGMAMGFQTCDHIFSKNGTISCVKCGKTTTDLSKWDLIKWD
ncbi:hypothetical protein [Candidatus Nitrosopumilus sediminis]|uniref:hypothetical protein n=1 Tax=Candidatus Nitrosopumilus sediminis TaxID=1229909 RepID=UPI00035E800D|nr:hypothetical protein [Candidatus Nitrosopumilus sediminis]